MPGCALEIDCRRGDVERAKERLSSMTDESEDPQVRASHALYTAIVLRAEGDPAAALEELQPALDARDSPRHPVPHREAGYHRGARVRFRARRRGTDRSRARGDRRAPPGERPPLLTAHAARFRAREDYRRERGRARVPWRCGDLPRPPPRLLARCHGARVWRMAERAGPARRGRSLLAEAHETFERLGATPWIHRAAEARLRGEPAEPRPSSSPRSRTPRRSRDFSR